MKRLSHIFAVFALIIGSMSAAAQEAEPLISDTLATNSQSADDSGYDFWKHKKEIRLAYNIQSLEQGSYTQDAKFGVSLNTARTIYVHRKPIGGMLKFGIDYGFALDYANFDDKIDGDYYGYTGPFGYTGTDQYYDEDDDDDFNIGSHMANIGINLGPSATLRLFRNMRIKAYCYFVPSLSLRIANSEAATSFVPFVTPGVSVGWKAINIGFQWKTGRGKYKDIVGDIIGEEGMSADMPKIKYRTNSYQIYLSLSF